MSLDAPELLATQTVNGEVFKAERIPFDSQQGIILHPGHRYGLPPGVPSVSYRFTNDRYPWFVAWFPITLLGKLKLSEADLWGEIALKVPHGASALTQPTPASKALPAGGTTTYRFDKGSTPLLGDCIRFIYLDSGVESRRPAVLGRHRLNELFCELIRIYWK
jgi:hypothetical protein